MLKRLTHNFAHLLTDPHAFAAQRGIRGRRAFNLLYKAAAPLRYLRLRRLCGKIPRIDHDASPLCLPEDQGFALWTCPEFGTLHAAIDEANRILNSKDLNSLVADLPDNRPFLSIPIELNSESPIARLALHESLILPFARYLGTLPTLGALGVMYSPNHRNVAGSSQYFHLDGQDIRSLQVFIFLDDVTSENGPLCLLPAAVSERVLRRLKYRKTEGQRRVSDEAVASCVDLDKETRVLTGKKGDVLVFDGDRCLHYGSRVATKPRRILHLFYMTQFGFTLKRNLGDQYTHLLPATASPWQRAIVSSQ